MRDIGTGDIGRGSRAALTHRLAARGSGALQVMCHAGLRARPPIAARASARRRAAPVIIG
jgi:hypothetical protein